MWEGLANGRLPEQSAMKCWGTKGSFGSDDIVGFSDDFESCAFRAVLSDKSEKHTNQATVTI